MCTLGCSFRYPPTTITRTHLFSRTPIANFSTVVDDDEMRFDFRFAGKQTSPRPKEQKPANYRGGAVAESCEGFLCVEPTTADVKNEFQKR